MRSKEIPEGYYLVCYDYGTGGVWWLIRAGSSEEIKAASQQLTVFETVPDWIDLGTIERDDIGMPKSDALRLILAGEG
jgi:hypothetical protein